MGLLQRVFDEHGLATVSLTQVREISELAKLSLACLVEHPFGLTLGAVGDEATHRAGSEGVPSPERAVGVGWAGFADGGTSA